MNPLKPLQGVRVLSLALNLPGPAALMRLRAMGATCIKLEAPAAAGHDSSDPMAHYCRAAYDEMHAGIRRVQADLKTPAGQRQLQRLLARTDVLLTSFRPSALRKLGLEWKSLRRDYPTLSIVAIVGSPGVRADEPGHDLTYLAEAGLLEGLATPPTLFADMAGALLAAEAVLQATLHRLRTNRGCHQEVALSAAAAWLALPRHWGLTAPGAAVGGGHAGYRLYACRDGRVAVAALEPHFARALCETVGLQDWSWSAMFQANTHAAIEAFCARQTQQQLQRLAAERDIPLHTLPSAV